MAYIDKINVEGINYDLGVMESLKDKNGHARFVEGDGVIEEHQPAFTNAYCKWSLSGSHLMLVLAGEVANTDTISSYYQLCSYNLPEWIMNKIYAVWGNYIEAKEVSFKASDWSEQTATIALKKNISNLDLLLTTDLVLTADRGFRIQFDLLIDND